MKKKIKKTQKESRHACFGISSTRQKRVAGAGSLLILVIVVSALEIASLNGDG